MENRATSDDVKLGWATGDKVGAMEKFPAPLPAIL